MKSGSDSREKISIIIPVYNVEKYLSRCVESVLSQTYDDLEIILVDDGSTDTSGYICDSYAVRDSRIRVLHKKNGGLSSARNAGLALATGNYIGFVDSDDYIEKDMFEKLFCCAQNNDADIAVGSRFIEEEDGNKKSYVSNKIKSGILSKEVVFEKIFSYSDFDMAMWDKIYKRKLFNGIEFPEGKTQEDYYVALQIIERSSKIYYLSEPLYHYVQRSGSITRNKKVSNDGITASEYAVDFFKKNHPELSYVGGTALAFSYISVVNKHMLNEIPIEKQFRDQAQRVVKKNMRYVWKNGSIDLRKKVQTLCFCMSLNIYSSIISRAK